MIQYKLLLFLCDTSWMRCKLMCIDCLYIHLKQTQQYISLQVTAMSFVEDLLTFWHALYCHLQAEYHG